MRNCKSIIQMPFHSLREHPVHEVQFLAPVLHSAEKKNPTVFSRGVKQEPKTEPDALAG